MNDAIKEAIKKRDAARSVVDAASSAEAAAKAEADIHEKERAAMAVALKALEERHSAHIAAGASAKSSAEHSAALDAAMESKAAILRASIEVEFAVSKATASTTHHHETVSTLKAAQADLRTAAIAVADAEDSELAERCEAMRIAYESLCRQLKSRVPSVFHIPLNQAPRHLPPIVVAAIENMPIVDDLRTPISETGQITQADWHERIEKAMGNAAVA